MITFCCALNKFGEILGREEKVDNSGERVSEKILIRHVLMRWLTEYLRGIGARTKLIEMEQNVKG